MSVLKNQSDFGFDYQFEAELFPARGRRRSGRLVKYMRFDNAADALRFAIEELPNEALLGAYLEVNEQRYDSGDIRRLYESNEYPHPRRAKVA